ncbi:hypothetical protein [Cellulomonas hominis]
MYLLPPDHRLGQSGWDAWAEEYSDVDLLLDDLKIQVEWDTSPGGSPA